MTYIDHAQIKDVRPSLGYVFWKEIIDNVGDDGVIDALLDGGDYAYSGKTYENPGLKEVIARYSYARYAMFGHKTDTASGSLVKTNQDARETNHKEKKDTYDTNRQIAFEQWTLVADFLNRKNSDYPLWKGPQKTSFRATIIRKN